MLDKNDSFVFCCLFFLSIMKYKTFKGIKENIAKFQV